MIVQTVLIRWMKDTRGEPYASARSRYPVAFPLPTVIPSLPDPEGDQYIWVHRLTFRQTPTGFERLSDICEWLPTPSVHIETGHARLPGLFLQKRTEGLAVRFAYDPSFGKPVRTDYESHLLDEQAFILRNGEYGRIIINGRHTLEEGSLYELRTVNIWNTEDLRIPNKDQSDREPNHTRKYLASLW